MILKFMNNKKFFLSLLICLIIGLSFFTFVSAQVNPITGMQTAVKDTGLDSSPDLPTFVGSVIKAVLGMLAVLFLILTIYAGVMWMLARGDEGKIKTAKGTIISSLTGFIIIMLAYGITSFVVNLFRF